MAEQEDALGMAEPEHLEMKLDKRLGLNVGTFTREKAKVKKGRGHVIRAEERGDPDEEIQ